MAYTGTIQKKDVFGATRAHMINVTADAASGAVDTGLSVIYGHSLGPISMATSAIIVRYNKNSGATAVGGSLAFSAAASGDNFFVTVYGA